MIMDLRNKIITLLMLLHITTAMIIMPTDIMVIYYIFFIVEHYL